VVSHRCFALPRSSILCGCINIPGRQVNAVTRMRCRVDALPHTACTMYVEKKKLGVCWGLFDKISPAFELRNSGVPAVVRLSQLPLSTLRRPIKSRLRWSSRSPRTTDMPLCCSSWAVSSLYLPKTALAALANLQSEDLTSCKSLPSREKLFPSPKPET
jgi:hypothetical protein